MRKTTKELNKRLREEEKPILERRYYLISLELEVNEMLKAIEKTDKENVTREQRVPQHIEAVKKANQKIREIEKKSPYDSEVFKEKMIIRRIKTLRSIWKDSLKNNEDNILVTRAETQYNYYLEGIADGYGNKEADTLVAESKK